MFCGLDFVFTMPIGLGSPHQVSTPSRFNGLGSALPRFHRGFAEFEEFYSFSFPKGTQILKSADSSVGLRGQISIQLSKNPLPPAVGLPGQ